MSNWRNRSSKPANRGRGQLAHRGTQTLDAPPKRQMEHIASVSRSSGLEKDGDTLKDFKVQEDYRAFLQGKVNDFLRNHPDKMEESEQEASSRINARENVLILFRKLREGIFSSNRRDAFALEVYETSLYLAASFDSPKQSTSITPHLIPHLYLTSPPPHTNRLITTIISLLHHLVVAYPSQSSFRQHFDMIPRDFIPQDSESFEWIMSLSKSLRTQNYSVFELLTRPSKLSSLFATELSGAMQSLSISTDAGETLPRQAFYALVQSLRNKARSSAWNIIRAAYRELSCDISDTQVWLQRTLCLSSVVTHDRDIDLAQWLEAQIPVGHTRQKEGVKGRWIICKVQ